MLATAVDRVPTWWFLCPLGKGLGHKEFDGYMVGQMLLLQVLAEDDENGFWDHSGRL